MKTKKEVCKGDGKNERRKMYYKFKKSNGAVIWGTGITEDGYNNLSLEEQAEYVNVQD